MDSYLIEKSSRLRIVNKKAPPTEVLIYKERNYSFILLYVPLREAPPEQK